MNRIEGRLVNKKMKLEQFQQKYDYSSPLFPMIGQDIWGQTWEEFKKNGAAIVPQEEIDADQYFNGDGDCIRSNAAVIYSYTYIKSAGTMRC